LASRNVRRLSTHFESAQFFAGTIALISIAVSSVMLGTHAGEDWEVNVRAKIASITFGKSRSARIA
jgi:hypothetical protein